MDSDDYSTDDVTKRKRNLDDGEECFGRSKRTVRTPTKGGTRSEDKLDLLLNMVKELQIDVKEIKKENSEFRKELKTLKSEYENLRKENDGVKQENIIIRRNLAEMENKVELLEKEKWKEVTFKQAQFEKDITALKAQLSNNPQATDNESNHKSLDLLEQTDKKLKKVEQLLNDQEKECKKLNIIIKNHNWELTQLQENTRQFLSEKFNVGDNIVEIHVVDRSGKIIRVKLNSHLAKDAIMSTKASVLRESKISIVKDLTSRELEQRKNLVAIAKEKNALGLKTVIIGNKLKIDGIWHYWDHNLGALKLDKILLQRSTTGRHQTKEQHPKNLQQ